MNYRYKWNFSEAAGSVMDNLAEGYGKGENREFTNFLRIAKDSAEEVKSQAIRAYDKEYIIREECKEIYDLANQIGGKLKGLIDFLNKTE